MKPTEKQIETYEKQILSALYLIYKQQNNPGDYVVDMVQRIEQRLKEIK